jgi:hypothetical protein
MVIIVVPCRQAIAHHKALHGCQLAFGYDLFAAHKIVMREWLFSRYAAGNVYDGLQGDVLSESVETDTGGKIWHPRKVFFAIVIFFVIIAL